MAEPAKRVTVSIKERFNDAYSLNEFLCEAGLNSIIVTKHAVQVHAAHAERLPELAAKWKAHCEQKDAMARGGAI